MMSCLLSGNSCCTISASARLLLNTKHHHHKRRQNLQLRASTANDDDDCNVEECAPDKEIQEIGNTLVTRSLYHSIIPTMKVGKVSMEWLAGEKTKVAGTFPPRKKGWTGYVEKDTAGQTNIYSIEPAVYIAESAISSGTSGSSSDGSENTAAIIAGLALISIAAASSVLLQVGKSPTVVVQTAEYSGPSLSYYINEFKPLEITEASAPPVTETETSSQDVQVSGPEVPPEETPPSLLDSTVS
ncbi:3'-5' DNA helicase [Castilleja foliolosa]|uniref:3'-5' DNA helicase n=1 Tax=Castilleja foliolosa TaxID=1961234 RepID=A0ABD3CK87_9LAMI